MKEKVLKRILVILMLVMFLTGIVFGAFNRPREVKGAIFETIGLGAGALGALVAAYFATAGITFSGSADTDGNFLGNYVSNWVKNSSSFASNPYFNSDGEFIGSSDDLSIVQNNDNDIVSIIFGKEFAIWMEALKQQFVSSNNLTDQELTSIYQESSIIDSIGNQYAVYNGNGSAITSDYVSLIYPLEVGSSFNCTINQTEITVTITALNNNRWAVSYQSIVNGSVGGNSLGYRANPSNFRLYFATYNQVGLDQGTLGLFAGMVGEPNASTRVALFPDAVISDMTLTGELTEGYEDFEDAINQDLTNADEEEVAVVGVGEFPQTLDVDGILNGILDKIIGGTLNPTYEGTRENMGAAEEETEGERPFVPVLPEGWVKVEGLQSFFPFCIPFDLYNTIALLNVPAEAPRFTWRMGFGSVFEPYDIDIDFSPYETVARIFRVMVVIVFLLFLILKTRDLIRG